MKPKLTRLLLILSGYKAHQKELAMASCIQSRLSKNTIKRVLQSPVSSNLAPSKMEAIHRPQQAQYLSSSRKIPDGNARVHQGVSGSRGLGVFSRPLGCLYPCPHPPDLKGGPSVQLQVSNLSVHFASFWPSHGPSDLYNDNPPIPGLVSGRGTTARCLMWQIGLLASTEKMIPEDCFT